MKFQLPRSSVQKSIPHGFQWFPLSHLAYGMGTTLYDCSLTEQSDFVIYRLFQEWSDVYIFSIDIRVQSTKRIPKKSSSIRS